MSQSNNSALAKVDAGINQLCDELKLTPFVRTKCLEMSGRMEKEGGSGLTGSEANAVACSVVSLVHEEARRHGRVSMHLPDRMIGKVFGIDSVTIVHSKHIMNSRQK
jgi:hypothetical protein